MVNMGHFHLIPILAIVHVWNCLQLRTHPRIVVHMFPNNTIGLGSRISSGDTRLLFFLLGILAYEFDYCLLGVLLLPLLLHTYLFVPVCMDC
jgi:hypothetical protein